ncbi:FAD-dependent oxidoreductase [Pyruvatibacter sp.]|uniref:flavin-containing monooxygenase n=1 Tax=Pyruvatibacter sp. TaxID=1981328 RepID=UPI0032657BAC
MTHAQTNADIAVASDASASAHPVIEDHVAVIGAGAAGLSAARALRTLGIPVTVFEKHSDVGGIWDVNNPGSPMYRSAHFISSKTMSGHKGFPMPDHYPDYPSNGQILDYIRSFADANSLRDDITFNTMVNNVEQHDNGWLVTTTGPEGTKTGGYRWLICASGTTWTPNRPTLPGEENFTGEIHHANQYSDAEVLKGKRVLIIGAGNSAVDIACDAAFAADEAHISFRRGYHFVPKHIFGKPADVFGEGSNWMPMKLQQYTFGKLLNLLNGDLSRLGLPKPDHKPLESHPIMNSQLLHYLNHGDVNGHGPIERLEGNRVHFKKGEKIEVDLIILATGYNWSLPYLPDGLLEWENGRPKTFAKIFTPQHKNLFLSGFLEVNGGIYGLMDEMGLAIAKTIETQLNHPKRAAKIDSYINGPEPDMSGNVNYVKSDRHTGYGNKTMFLKVFKDMRKRFGWPEVDAFYGIEKSKTH